MPVLQRAFAERGQLSKLVWGASGVCRERTPAELAEAARYVLDGPGDIRRTWATFVDKHDFDVTPHVLRHTRITLLLRAGVSVWDVSGLVGASPDVIQKVYGHHAADDRLRAQANRRANAA
jgi:integrase